MSDRYHALTVILEEPIKDEDAAALIAAIRQLRGVLAVEPHVHDHVAMFARMTARQELERKLWEVLHD